MRKNLLKRAKIKYLKAAVFTLFLSALFMPSLPKIEEEGNNYFTVFLNGKEVGFAGSEEEVKTYLVKARRMAAAECEGMMFADPELVMNGQEVYFGRITDEEVITDNMRQAFLESRISTTQKAYTVKINNFTANLSSQESVVKLLQAAIDKYDSTGNYKVGLVQDGGRQLNVLTAKVTNTAEETETGNTVSGANDLPKAGFFASVEESVNSIEVDTAEDMSAHNRGLIEMEFGDPVEVVEAYMSDASLTDLSVAIEEVTKDQEKNQIYEVVSGDTLGEIAIEHNMTVEELVANNEILESENSTIRVGDELIISVPEPELSVIRVEEQYCEEDYNAEVEYILNDDWYTTDRVTRQQPSAGHRRVVAMVTYRNDAVAEREIVEEEVVLQAVPKIVEKGTKIPPTFIKPISGGRLSSGFGGRKAPKKGASTNHKGIDWSVPTGTAVMASCGGTVTKAGWGSGYGYVVYISHPGGRETRYAHLSKVLVSVGQQVSQGQKIALSGNTGNSTGPHLHFEIRINGSAVNPLSVLN